MTDTASQHLAASTFKVRAHAADRGFISIERAASSADALEAELISEGLTPVSCPGRTDRTKQARASVSVVDFLPAIVFIVRGWLAIGGGH